MILKWIQRAMIWPVIIKDELDELLYADIWHDTVSGIGWTKELGPISPGRYAVGYNYLYVMTRALNELKPHRVLDIGLGISSALISAYFRSCRYTDAKHLILEHDAAWIDFYKKEHQLSPYASIAKMELKEERLKYRGGVQYQHFRYDNIGPELKKDRYAVISIDAPYGSRHHSRDDILRVLPDILEPDFVILMDDANRKGERETIKMLENLLHDKGISYRSRVYRGNTHVCVIASESNAFLCTL